MGARNNGQRYNWIVTYAYVYTTPRYMIALGLLELRGNYPYVYYYVSHKVYIGVSPKLHIGVSSKLYIESLHSF